MRLLALLGLFVVGCGRSTPVSVDLLFGEPRTPGAADPPYESLLTFPNGLRVSLVTDADLSRTYPSAAGNPFGASRARHYRAVGFFLPLDRLPLSERVSENFRLSEYVSPTIEHGGRLAYVDAQIAYHAQEIRSGLGRPVILSSAFRAPEHNAAVGGASYSRHQYGDAIDIDVDQSRGDANTVAQEVFNEAMDVGVDYVEPLIDTSVEVGGVLRASWVHLDDRGFR